MESLRILDFLESASKKLDQLNTASSESILEDAKGFTEADDLASSISDVNDTARTAFYARMKDCLVADWYSRDTVYEYRQ